jgi:hypothetical protein
MQPCESTHMRITVHGSAVLCVNNVANACLREDAERTDWVTKQKRNVPQSGYAAFRCER